MYITIWTFSTTKQVELVGKKEFAVLVFESDYKTFTVYIVILISINVHPFCRAQIALLIQDNTFPTISSKYTDFANIYSFNLIVKLLEYIKINNNPISLVKNEQPAYKPIYSLELVELKILKTYMKTNLANSFIRPFRLSVRALIFFVYKHNKSLQLCINYQSLNNLTIKNQYFLPLLRKLLDWLG